jgi:hypothetical protein
MEGEISTETKPRLFKSGRVLPVDTLIADPSITVIEIGEALGFLLSESCYDSETGNFILENVTWCRYIIPKRQSIINRSFSKVELYLHNSGIFVAQDTQSKNYLPFPSAESYWVIFIASELYSKMLKAIEQKALNQLSELVIHDIQRLPEFSFKDNTVVASPNYASAATNGLEYNTITV